MSKPVRSTTAIERTIIFYDDRENEEGEVKTYDGKKIRMLSRQLIRETYKNPYDYDEVFVKFTKRNKEDTIKEAYKTFLKDAEELKEITNGKVNLWKTGSYVQSAFQLFKDLYQIEPEPLDELEATILSSTTIGSLRYAETEYKGKGYKYDIVSSYPAIMRTQNFPVSKGEFRTLTSKEFKKMKTLTYGCYHCEITDADPKVFKTNVSNHWYTHTDISFARQHEYTIKLIEDDNPNFLSYAGKLCSGKVMFAPFVDYLYALKNKGYKSPKKILNCLWGALCQSMINTFKMTADNSVKLFENEKLFTLMPSGDDDIIMQTINPRKQFKYAFARMKPFILSFGRSRMASFLELSAEDLVYSHTDGFVLSRRLKTNDKIKSKIGNDIGKLKYEGKCDKIIIHNMAAKTSLFNFIV
jgi:hypothetical protein